MEPEIAAQIIRGIVPGSLGLRERELDELAAFALAFRPYEAALPVLIKLLSRRLGGALCSDVLSNTERDALIAKVLQHRGWSDTASLVGASGRAQVTSLLRHAVGKLLEHHARPQP
jgi:tRNA(Met) cytidine acetyltransferase